MLVFWASIDSLKFFADGKMGVAPLSQDVGSWQVKVYRMFVEIPESKHVINLGGDFYWELPTANGWKYIF